MLWCWRKNPSERITFTELQCQLEKLMAREAEYLEVILTSTSQVSGLADERPLFLSPDTRLTPVNNKRACTYAPSYKGHPSSMVDEIANGHRVESGYESECYHKLLRANNNKVHYQFDGTFSSGCDSSIDDAQFCDSDYNSGYERAVCSGKTLCSHHHDNLRDHLQDQLNHRQKNHLQNQQLNFTQHSWNNVTYEAQPV